MSILKKLQNPFVLGAQGFVLGAALFLTGATRGEDQRPSAPPPATADVALIKSIGA